MNRREIGAVYEKRAAAYLQQQGVSLIQRNYRTQSGEIDLVGLDGDYLVFFEVKYRADRSFGDPLMAVDFHKQRQIIHTAKQYLYTHRCRADVPVRFDCIGICGTEIRWVKNAFWDT
ncbi:MAG: YraN family protein [Lachnospiraceae bacterium]